MSRNSSLAFGYKKIERVVLERGVDARLLRESAAAFRQRGVTHFPHAVQRATSL